MYAKEPVMSKSAFLKVGDFCWAELYANNIDKSLQFYTDLFNWNIESLPVGQDISYKLIKINDNAVAGGIRINEAMKKGGVPPHWNSFVLVEDIHESVALAKKLGGAIMRDAFDIPNKGKMAVIVDPTGASFSLWEPLMSDKDNQQSVSKSTSGNIGWNELITNDLDRANQFYCDLFKWTPKRKEFLPNETYITFMNKESPVAGMLKPVTHRNNPGPRWSLYFTTNDLDDCINKAKKLGGHLCYDPVSFPDIGRFTTIRDPDGVFFSVIQFDKS